MGYKQKKIPISTEDEVQGGASANGESSVDRDADFSLLDDDDSEEPSGERLADAGDSSSSDASELQRELEETRQNYLRALADLENFKKRTARERSELIKYQGERVFADLLDTIDNLELAVEYAEADPEKLREGVQLILKMFQDTLGRWEVRAVSGVGKQFDPNVHSAISRVPSEEHEPGIILNELKKAYFYKDRLLRAGEVVVVTAPEADNLSSESKHKPSGDDRGESPDSDQDDQAAGESGD